MIIEISIGVVIGIASALFGMIFGYMGFQINRDKELKKDAANDSVVGTKLDNISQGVDSIRVDMKVQEHNHTSLSEQVIRID